jgi:SAM-dependent methyltransferase
MELNQYKFMFEVEDHHWWYVGNHAYYLSLLQQCGVLSDCLTVLDAGCGTGRWLALLKASNNLHETGIDYQEVALDYAKSRGQLNLQLADLNQVAFDDSSFDLITSFDVICNTNVDDQRAIQSFYRWLRPGGYLLLNLPAYQFLLSKHDQVVHQNKRYRKRQLRFLLESRGFEVKKISYRVSFLFPIALIKRAIDKLVGSKDASHNEVKMPNKIINHIFLSIMRGENLLLRFLSLPLGLSVTVLAKKCE